MSVAPEKLHAQKQWNANPCGTGKYLSEIEYASEAFFDAIRRNRYELTDPWMKRTIPFSAAKGKRLLEIGHGLGTDLLTFSEAGADVYGIDLVEEHHRLATRNFELHGKAAVLKLCDAAQIDFPSGFFDFVYSHGVLHHTPDIERCIAEAHRVLKPGGQMVLSLYHTYSAFHLLFMFLYQGIVRGRLWRLGYRGLMATVEYGADGIHIKPLVRTYTRRQVRYMLRRFASVRIAVAHFSDAHVPLMGKLLPAFLERSLEPYLGWYVIAFATKRD